MSSYKEELKTLIHDLESYFINGGTEYLNWTQEDQEVVNDLLTRILAQVGSFDSQKKNEERNIKEELTIVDKETKEKIELVDASSMKNRVETVLTEKTDFFSLLRSLAVVNKCAHKCHDNYKQVEGQIEAIKGRMEEADLREKLKVSFPEKRKINVEGISFHEINKLLDTLGKEKANIGAIISIGRTLKMNMEEEKKDSSRLQEIFYQLKGKRIEIIEQYIEELKGRASQEREFRESLFWIKDQYIAMIGQLLASDERYSELEYEMVSNGEGEFQNMLAIDYPDLSYYIEVHMPNFIAHRLIEEYGLSRPVKNNQRKFESLGASAVYDREEEEVSRLRTHSLDNTRKRIIARRKRKAFADFPKRYSFTTRRIQIPEDISVGENFLNTIEEYEGKELEYSYQRSDEKGKGIEEKIAQDITSLLITEKESQGDDTAKQQFMKKLKEFAITEVSAKGRFQQVLYMYANDREDNEFIMLMAYEKVLKDAFNSDGGEQKKTNLVEMVKFIGEEIEKIKKTFPDPDVLRKGKTREGNEHDEQ